MPAGTQSFVLNMHDMDVARNKTTDDQAHWIVWNIPATATGLPEGVPKGAQLTSGMGKLVTPAPGSANVIRVIAAGEPANLVLRDAATQSAEMTMHDGEWLK